MHHALISKQQIIGNAGKTTAAAVTGRRERARIMRFTDITGIIGKDTDIRVISVGSDAEITDVKLWDGSSEASSASTLYFSYSTQSPKLPESCICAGDIDDPVAFSSSSNLAIIPADRFASVFNSVQDTVAELSNDNFYHYILDVADNVRSVEVLIDVASQSFNASLVFIDRDFRILAYSTQVPVTDVLWAENIRKGYCDYEFISEVRKLKSVQAAGTGTIPFEVTCSASPYRKLACRVYCRDSWIGSLLLIEGASTYRREHIDMLRILGVVTGYSILAYSPELLYRTSEYHKFLYDLIIGTPLESLPEAYRDLRFQDSMKVMFFKSSNSNEHLIKGSVIREEFHRVLPDCHVITHRKAAIVVCSIEDTQNAVSYLGLFPPECDVKAGISSVFYNIEMLRDALSEAQDALVIGSEIDADKRIFHFSEYSPYVMLKHLSEHEKITRYCHRAIPLLIEYDKANGTDLLDTLQSYLDSNCSIKDTAEALFLHRNSVVYRLRKIEELCEMSLSDPSARFSLRMSFIILRIS